jgi:hypothetical protein
MTTPTTTNTVSILFPLSMFFPSVEKSVNKGQPPGIAVAADLTLNRRQSVREKNQR